MDEVGYSSSSPTDTRNHLTDSRTAFHSLQPDMADFRRCRQALSSVSVKALFESGEDVLAKVVAMISSMAAHRIPVFSFGSFPSPEADGSAGSPRIRRPFPPGEGERDS